MRGSVLASGFKPLLSLVEHRYAELVDADLVAVYRDGAREHVPQGPGVYVLHERGNPLFVGRANHLRNRLGEQTLSGADPNVAPFAQQLAREAIGMQISSADLGGTREFRVAKERVHRMCVRWVEEPDPDCRYLLQFWTAKKLRIPFQPAANGWLIWFRLRCEAKRIADLLGVRSR